MAANLPNILSVARLFAAPVLALGFVFLPRPFSDWLALILFIGASLTDWLDGYLARAWGQVSKFGTMIDPIADKIMVVITLMVLVALFNADPLILIPAIAIVFREVFVSGLREYLGDTAGTLKVTQLAKWKTAIQMIAITLLLLQGLFAHYVGMLFFGLGELAEDVLTGAVPDEVGLIWKEAAMTWAGRIGVLLLWIAGILTLITGWDYFRKARPHLQDTT